MRRAGIIFLGLVVSLASAPAYYHYLHYTSRTAPFAPVPEKFDLSALPNKTLTFLVSDAGPTQFAPNDSFASVLAQVRQATQVWNAVETSDLRLAFGGLNTAGTPQSTPGVEVVFDDMPPGLLAFSGHERGSDTVTGPNGAFVPITFSVIHLSRDLTRRPGPSYLESFFLTVVHEIGHAIGLQHTFTSSAMSTAVTRATSRVRPIDADDIAGISLLYPRGNLGSVFGSISGRVTSGGQGVHMASVVALRASGSAISTLTNPDGTYRIDGLPPDNYWVYEHPLPPQSSADIEAPRDAGGAPVQPTGPTETLFYPGTREPLQFGVLPVARGAALTGIDFNVQRRPAVPIYDVVTFSFFGQNAASPAYVSASLASATIAARGVGVTTGAGATPGLGVQVLGGLGPVGVRAYGAPQTTLALDLVFPLFAGTGPRHLLFSLPNDIYVLPSGLNLVQKQPPSVAAVTTLADGTVSISGSNLGPDSQVFFDALPATIRVAFSGTDQNGTIVVAPPPGASGQRATITVFNADGQNSMFVQAQAPPTFTYDSTDAPAVTLAPNSLPAGQSAMIDVTSSNLRFADGRVTLGLGSSDVVVQRVWVLAPNHVIANVSVSPNAPPGASLASVMSGFELFSQPGGFQITAASPRLPTIALPVVNANAAPSGLFSGAVATIFGSNLANTPNSTTVTVGDQSAQVLSASATQINFQVPQNLPLGPAVLRVNNGSDSAFPVVIDITTPPPVITGVLSTANVAVDGAHPARAGDFVTLLLTGLDPAVLSSPERIRISEGGVDLAPAGMFPLAGQPNALQIQLVLSGSITGAQVPITVSVDGTVSSPVFIAVRGA